MRAEPLRHPVPSCTCEAPMLLRFAVDITAYSVCMAVLASGFLIAL